MEPISKVSFPKVESTIVNGALDANRAKKQDHQRTPLDRRLDEAPISVQDNAAPLPVGHSCTEKASVLDKAAGWFQRHLHFDRWFHWRKVTKEAPDVATVTDKLEWPASHSTAERTYTIKDNGRSATEMVVEPWKVDIRNTPAGQKVASQMTAKMAEADAHLADEIQAASK